MDRELIEALFQALNSSRSHIAVLLIFLQKCMWRWLDFAA